MDWGFSTWVCKAHPLIDEDAAHSTSQFDLTHDNGQTSGKGRCLIRGGFSVSNISYVAKHRQIADLLFCQLLSTFTLPRLTPARLLLAAMIIHMDIHFA